MVIMTNFKQTYRSNLRLTQYPLPSLDAPIFQIDSWSNTYSCIQFDIALRI